MLRDMEMRMMYQGMKLDDYLKYTGQTREQLRDMYKSQAEERVLSQLVIEAVKKAENIEATEEEIEAEIARYAEQSKMEVEKFKENLSDSDREYFAEAAAVRKTIDFLKANAA
jgi:trigger factor